MASIEYPVSQVWDKEEALRELVFRNNSIVIYDTTPTTPIEGSQGKVTGRAYVVVTYEKMAEEIANLYTGSQIEKEDAAPYFIKTLRTATEVLSALYESGLVMSFRDRRSAACP